MDKRRALYWHPTSSRMNRRKRLREARKKKRARFAVKSEAIKRPRIQLKQQIQPRILSDSCSSSPPEQLTMNRRGSMRGGKQEKDKYTHAWTPAEELFLLTPFNTDPAAEGEKYKDCKLSYYGLASDKLNDNFGDHSRGWVPFTPEKIKYKFKNFANRYEQYRRKGHPYLDKIPSEPYKLVEFYIAHHGSIFLESSRSGSSSLSRSTSASSRGVSKQQKTSHIPVNLDDEEDIEAAGKYILEHGSVNGVPPVDFFWYLQALHNKVARKGFWMMDDFEKMKYYLDGLVPIVKDQWKCSEMRRTTPPPMQ